ncbi:sporulation membrane protein YtaF [Bacillus sp. S/N-304-OC-R1]|uniref:sporulation membrane protein YtaF n=1 Tax=Bacillus sp. S/N-304-OC-R1 TaxID=2758034 RepID=UPI001C8F0363|nr:sporulation membrane protein YtaF [Bacillus sp. S/N-304-OC-R1]MBY0123760.1 sporulation membrane protein YtaF [Bacillus sp. S/N-304-OC-R1]
MYWLIILAFAASSSIDNLGIGISYGVRKIQIGITANLLIAAICYVMSLAGITFGLWISKTIPGEYPIFIGAFLLLIIGIRIILLAAPRKKVKVTDNEGLEKSYAGTQKTIDTEKLADLDRLKKIGWGEAAFLGIALSSNALTNSLGAGLLRLSPQAISLTAAIGSFFSILIGVKLGYKLSAVRIGSYSLGQFGTIISGIILVIIAATVFF